MDGNLTDGQIEGCNLTTLFAQSRSYCWYDDSFYWHDPSSEWLVEFTRVPKKQGSTGNTIRFLQIGLPKWVDEKQTLSGQITEKAGKYGSSLGLPYIIAVNYCRKGEDISPQEVEEMLYGECIIGEIENLDGSRSEKVHWQPGLFMTLKHQHVSAVIVCSNLHSKTLRNHHPILYHNPLAILPLAIGLFELEFVSQLRFLEMEQRIAPWLRSR